ncbi:MAG: hypothetical protein ACP8RL_09100 [cyanobacterium endosymbiont of Rhopalodia inflata]
MLKYSCPRQVVDLLTLVGDVPETLTKSSEEGIDCAAKFVHTCAKTIVEVSNMSQRILTEDK